MSLIGIVDYGAGNLMSVSNALRYLGLSSEIIHDPMDIDRADAIILPGVGAFPAAVECLSSSGFMEVIKRQAEKKPLLGICVGMQMLFTTGYEFRPCDGLGLIGGEVKKIDTDLKLPHIGWNSLDIHVGSPILKGIDNGAYVYFVHSYAGLADDSEGLVASSNYGSKITAVVQKGSVFGCQFHPEKSGDVGLEILRNFGDMI